MEDSRFDSLTRSLGTAGSRRRALGGLLAGTLGMLGWHDGDESAAHVITCQNKSGEAKKKCKQKAKKHKAAHASEMPPPPPPIGGGGDGDPPPRKPNAACNVERSGDIIFYKSADLRFAQTFTEPNGGQLTRAGVVLYNATDQTGEYLLQLNTVDSTGTPTINTIASASLPSSQVGRNPDPVYFSFATPATVVAGRQYALVLSVNSGVVEGGTECHVPLACPGGQLFFYNTTTFRFQAYGGCASGGPSEFAFYETNVVP